MNAVNIRNATGTQVDVDGVLYELPYQIQTILELSEYIVIHCFTPTTLSNRVIHTEGYSLFCFGKQANEIIWKMKDTISVGKIYLPAKKDESWFGTKEQYQKYLNEFKQKELLVVDVWNFEKLVDPSNGEIIDYWITK